MIKSLLLVILLVSLVGAQSITPYYVLPVQTTQNVITTYSFLFHTDTEITSNALVAITFPFEFSPNALTQVSRVRYLTNGTALQNATFSLSRHTFSIQVQQIAIGNITIVIDGVRNPDDYTTSSFFSVETRFKNVAVTSNRQFARVPFTKTPGKTYSMQWPLPEGRSTTT
jgi:hypothetical protein